MVSPYATGDAIKNKWAKTDFSLYSGSHAGVFGALIGRTNVEGIVQVDLLATDYFRGPAYPTYLFYNPYPEEKVVEIPIGAEPTNIYDAVRKEFVVQGAQGRAFLSIPSDTAAVVVLIPAEKEVVRKDGKLWAGGIVVDWQAEKK